LLFSIVHYSLPSTIEGLYQESGRAGRDGLPSHSLIYYDSKEASSLKFLINKEASNISSKIKNAKQRESILKSKKIKAEKAIVAFENVCNMCKSLSCRRNAILNFFGEQLEISSDVQQNREKLKSYKMNCCNYCRNPETARLKMVSNSNRLGTFFNSNTKFMKLGTTINNNNNHNFSSSSNFSKNIYNVESNNSKSVKLEMNNNLGFNSKNPIEIYHDDNDDGNYDDKYLFKENDEVDDLRQKENKNKNSFTNRLKRQRITNSYENKKKKLNEASKSIDLNNPNNMKQIVSLFKKSSIKK
jgi:superfamily II DNA helicase RecQ